jgi:hypothetical protein
MRALRAGLASLVCFPQLSASSSANWVSAFDASQPCPAQAQSVTVTVRHGPDFHGREPG